MNFDDSLDLKPNGVILAFNYLCDHDKQKWIFNGDVGYPDNNNILWITDFIDNLNKILYENIFE